ncbi:NADH:flavin oxidoreductase [Clostridium intestinale]|uniref:NADH:flavin oxidoreductase n=1 Tax=Clostridium intestinale TaxID=36845 RepID=UPI0028F0BB93|nr:NADH:flavin oxidoreductase [Clostridium intestinale]
MSKLFNSIQIGSLNLNSRLVMPPMATGKAPDGNVTEDILKYYDDKSQGGYIGLIVIEHSYISPEGKAHKNQLSVSEGVDIDKLKALADIIHKNGSKAVMQINHAGIQTSEEVTGFPSVGPSSVANSKGVVAKELSVDEIKGIVKAFGEAASRVKAAGFDGVEIHGAHGYLLHQFFTPLTNKRTDSYGGDVKNRIRIHLEVIEAVRKAVGENFPILLRLGASDYTEGGVTIEDSLVAGVEFEKAGINILDVSGGVRGFVVPGANEEGYFWPLTEALKEALSIPVVLTGGIVTPEAAEKLLEEEKADLIGVGRSIYKDSEWSKKAFESLK